MYDNGSHIYPWRHRSYIIWVRLCVIYFTGIETNYGCILRERIEGVGVVRSLNRCEQYESQQHTSYSIVLRVGGYGGLLCVRVRKYEQL